MSESLGHRDTHDPKCRGVQHRVTEGTEWCDCDLILDVRMEQLTRDDRRSLAALYGWAAGQEEEIGHVKQVIAEHYKVAPKAAEPLLRALGYWQEVTS